MLDNIVRINFRDNPNLGDGNLTSKCFVIEIPHFRDNPKLGDGNLKNALAEYVANGEFQR